MQQCIGGLCIPSQCVEDGDCQGNNKCFKGFCIPSLIPTVECEKASDCPKISFQGTTVQLTCALNTCVPQIPNGPNFCNGDGDCAANQQCLIAVCAPKQCSLNSDCKADQACTFGLCTPKGLTFPAPGQCKTTADCTAPAQCLFSACVPVPPGLPIPGGGGAGGIDLCVGGQKCPAGKTCQFGVVCL
jgi:hypothetical protein